MAEARIQPNYRLVGTRVPRHDAIAKSRGLQRYSDDIDVTQMLYAKVKRSDYPAAILRKVDTSKAKALPGGAERDELLAKAENLLFAEDGWTVCPLYFYTQQYCLKNLKNVGWTPLGYFIFSYAEAAE